MERQMEVAMTNSRVLSKIVEGLENVVNDILKGLPDLRDTAEHHHFVRQVQTCKLELLSPSPDEEIFLTLGDLFNELLDLATQEAVKQECSLLDQYTQIHPN